MLSRRTVWLALVFAVAFVTMGIQRVDPVAEHAPLGFRLIVLPGSRRSGRCCWCVG